MRPFLLLLLAGCAPSDPSGDTRRPLDESDADTDADADADADADTDTDAEPSATCEALSDARGRCALWEAAHWEAADLTAVVPLGDGLTLSGSGLTAGTDTTGAYNGGDYVYGVVDSPVLVPGVAFDGVVPSWNATTPPGTWISIQVQARVGGAWTAWYRLGVWASGASDVERHSFEGERDADGAVYTDTLLLEGMADAVRLRATLFSTDGAAKPTLARLAVAVADTGAGRATDQGGEAWGTLLDVDPRSQMVFEAGEAWCSPTSTSMILSWWASQEGRPDWEVTVPEAAEGTWDHVYEGNGNWPFNTAYAGSLGLAGEVAWFDSVSDLEPWLAAGVPVAISAAWGPGDLDGAPISSTAGHLLVVRGFTAEGDVAVADPASPSDDTVYRTYDRAQFEDVWMNGSGGIAYVIWPGGPRP